MNRKKREKIRRAVVYVMAIVIALAFVLSMFAGAIR